MSSESQTKQCPYCSIAFSLDGVDAHHSIVRFQGRSVVYGGPQKEAPSFTFSAHLCPACEQPVMWLNELESDEDALTNRLVRTELLWPHVAQYPVPPEIPSSYKSALTEAAAVLKFSPNASAALSRRALQQVIRERGGVRHATLFKEIDEVLASGTLPPYLARDLDVIRRIGNLGAHPEKDTNTGEIVDVEPGEAEWTLSVLDELLKFFFVDDARSKARWTALNERLAKAGKKIS
jgi:Domain of unknown function (DUF4145)